MPKLTEEKMLARRRAILEAAKNCFTLKGFQATTMSDIAKEGRISIGGIYVHFDSKHAIAREIGGEATQGVEPTDFLEMFDALQTAAGVRDAKLDLNLWAEATRDDELAGLVHDSCEAFRSQGRDWASGRSNVEGWAALIEALALGLEVQRALGRPCPKSLRDALATLLEEQE